MMKQLAKSRGCSSRVSRDAGPGPASLVPPETASPSWRDAGPTGARTLCPRPPETASRELLTLLLASTSASVELCAAGRLSQRTRSKRHTASACAGTSTSKGSQVDAKSAGLPATSWASSQPPRGKRSPACMFKSPAKMQASTSSASEPAKHADSSRWRAAAAALDAVRCAVAAHSTAPLAASCTSTCSMNLLLGPATGDTHARITRPKSRRQRTHTSNPSSLQRPLCNGLLTAKPLAAAKACKALKHGGVTSCRQTRSISGNTAANSSSGLCWFMLKVVMRTLAATSTCTSTTGRVASPSASGGP